jgi:drug/metabolite transporter (DMT)-like permease
LSQVPAQAVGVRVNPVLLYGLMLLMVLFWALNFIIGKVALREFPSLLLAGLRVGMAALILAPIFALDRKKETGLRTSTRGEMWWLMGLGCFGVALNQIFFALGLARTSVAHAAILMGMTPMIVLGLAGVTGLERITIRKLCGMAVALVGVAVLNAAPPNGTQPSLLGDFYIFLAAFTFALFAVGGKRVTTRYRSITVNTLAYISGALMLLPLTITQSIGFDYAAVSLAAWVSLFYMAAFPSVLSYLIFYYALTKIPASRVSAFGYMQPLIATLLAIPLLGESISLPIAAGGALVFAGVYLAERS